MAKILPTQCPSCRGSLSVQTLVCSECGTEVKGEFELPRFIRLSSEEQDFILEFVRCSGSIKELAKHMELSYPTVRNRLDEIIDKLNTKR